MSGETQHLTGENGEAGLMVQLHGACQLREAWIVWNAVLAQQALLAWPGVLSWTVPGKGGRQVISQCPAAARIWHEQLKQQLQMGPPWAWEGVLLLA